MKDMMQKMQGTLEQIVEKQNSWAESSGNKQQSHNHEKTTGSNRDHERGIERCQKLELPIFVGEDPIG